MAIFRVRNLLFQVLPEVLPEDCDDDSGVDCDGDSGVDCDDDSGVDCDDDDDSGVDCDDSCDDGDDTCPDGSGCDDGGDTPCPDGSGCIPPTPVCELGPCSLHMRTNECEQVGISCLVFVMTNLCGPGTPDCQVLNSLRTLPTLNPNSLADLGVLRRQLAANLKVVRLRERALARALTPKTPRQIKAAEMILDKALRDLKARKQFVQARAAKKAAKAPTKKGPAKESASKRSGRKK
jgi:hypothetical protein